MSSISSATPADPPIHSKTGKHRAQPTQFNSTSQATQSETTRFCPGTCFCTPCRGPKDKTLSQAGQTLDLKRRGKTNETLRFYQKLNSMEPKTVISRRRKHIVLPVYRAKCVFLDLDRNVRPVFGEDSLTSRKKRGSPDRNVEAPKTLVLHQQMIHI